MLLSLVGWHGAAVGANPPLPAGGELTLHVAAAKLQDPDNPYEACGGSTELDVSPGDPVGICYTFDNGTDDDLNFQRLSDNVAGLFVDSHFTIPANSDFPIPVVQSFVMGTQSQTRTTVWNGRTDPSDFVASVGSGSPEQLFQDGFDGGTDGAAFIDITSIGTRYEYGSRVALPFPVNFSDAVNYGVGTSFCVVSSGLLTFNEDQCPLDGDNVALPAVPPDVGAFAPLVAPYWDAMESADGIYYATLGVAPKRQFVVEWSMMKPFGTDDSQAGVTFEVVFNEIDGSIDFNYLSTSFGAGDVGVDHGASATVGLQYDAFRSNQFSYDRPALRDNMSIHWAPLTVVTHSATSEAITLNVGSPVIALDPSSGAGVAFDIESGTGSSAPLSIGNTGNRPLHWWVGDAPAGSHFPSVAAPTARPASADHPIAVVTASRDPIAPASVTDDEPEVEAVPAMAVNGHSLVEGGEIVSDLVYFNALDPDAGFAVASTLPPYTFYNSGDFLHNDFATYWSWPQEIDVQSGHTSTYFFDPNDTFGLPPSYPRPIEPRGMKWDPQTSRSYFIATSSNDTSCYSHLFIAGFSPPVMTYVGSSSETCMVAIAIDRNGLIYGIGQEGVLYAIDKTTGRTRAISPIAIDIEGPYWRGSSFDFDDATGQLYLQMYEIGPFRTHIYTLDPMTGQAVRLGTFPAQFTYDVDIRGIAIAREDPSPCTHPFDVPWLSYSATSGTTAAGDTGSVSIQVSAADLAPGTYSANICVLSNDPHDRRVSIPLTLSVH